MTKPRILCLHGDGTNAGIFEAQTREVRKALEQDFELVYTNGPFECEAGYAVRPFFDGCGPFFRWTRGEPGGDPTGTDLFDGVINVMSDVAFEYDDGGDDCESAFAGILGFSSSAGIVAGILKEQSFREVYDLPPLLSMKFNFGILINGHGSPLRFRSLSDDALSDVYRDHLINVPSIHTLGTLDEWLTESWALSSSFSDRAKVCLEFKTDHRVPVEANDVRELVTALHNLTMK